MKTRSIRWALLAELVVGGAVVLAQTPAGRPTPDAAARQILDAAGVPGGLIVHLGVGDGKLTAALRASDSYVVHGLAADAEHVAAARQHIQSRGLYGPVSVEQWTSPRLPYADNLVNLVVVSGLPSIDRDEVLRVLCPGGVAVTVSADSAPAAEGGSSLRITDRQVKPRPAEIDEWTHFLHDAGNNAVARDTRVGPPRALQWLAPPLWLRSHETPSGFQTLVCAGGRVFYVLDEGLIGITDQRLPERWALVCRDAFNGTLLWRRPIEPWGWPQWAADKFADKDWTTITGGRTAVPEENQRRLVADGDRVYATLGYRAPLAILEAATGQTLATVAETAPVRQILAADGVALVYTQAVETGPAKRRGKSKDADQASGTLIAVRGSTGAVLWRKRIAPVRGLALAIDHGRVIAQAGPHLIALDLQTGAEHWQAEPEEANSRTLVACAEAVVILGPKALEVRDAATGHLRWHQAVPTTGGLGGEDLFVIDGVIWPGLLSVDEDQNPSPKSPHALAIGYDLRTGAERKRVFAAHLRSPEHHHRCYRNKATECYLISAMEGAEFLDLRGADHSQNNFVRGACRLGLMPGNGMLYVPPDQCFCQPGAKLLGFAAIGPAGKDEERRTKDEERRTKDEERRTKDEERRAKDEERRAKEEGRLERGPAYGAKPGTGVPGYEVGARRSGGEDWPTYRHDAARHGSTPAAVAADVQEAWRAKLGGGLTAPVAVGERVYVASRETHTLHALNLRTGEPAWTFIAGGRIDSPPTWLNGLLLFGSADGWVYCLRADDGALVWRFRAAPDERRIACFDQLESVWPVHGSVLVRDGIAYVTAGRSTYLDGGLRVYGLEPATGKVLHQTTLAGPFPDGPTTREVSFYIEGANTDVLVSEGDAIYLRQKRLTPALEEQRPAVLSSKGEKDVGLHVFSTAGLLDSSWYNRTFWMYAQRWPGFQLVNQAPKSGQLLVVDEQHTYGVKVFYRRNVHSTMFFPGREGYLLFADKNETEPQIVGEPGARRPVPWLPQSDYERREGMRTLDSEAFGLDKMIGYTRAAPPLWTLWLPVRVRALVKAGETLFVAGPPDVLEPADPYAAFEGRLGARLVAVSARDGKQLRERPLDALPVFDGLIAMPNRLLLALEDGSLLCLTGAAP